MKPPSRLILSTALSAFFVLANAQEEDDIPKKLQNASPEIRAAYGLPPVAQKQPLRVDLAMLRAMAGGDGAHCASVKVSGPVKFRNRTLIEIPDITEPELRLANQLMSSGCYLGALDKLEAVTRAKPDNRNANYVIARLSWMLRGASFAEQVLQQTLEAHSDFLSAKVLLAGIRQQQEKLPEVTRILDEVEPRSPTDLWIYMNRLRLEVFNSPSNDLRVRLLEIARSPAFPPNAREEAADIAKYVPHQTPQQFEEVLRASLDIDSYVGMACKAAELAFWLSESEGRFQDVIKLLESPRSKQGNCLGLETNRTLLAQAYLMEAAKISARPSPANQHLLDRADQILNGDYTSVAAHAQSRPQYAKLKPFLENYVHPDEMDAHGVTKLCHAIWQLNVAVVREQLEAGADPNGRCHSNSLVGSLVFMATNEKDDQRREVMGALLEHGAPVTNIEACRSRDNGDCFEVLLPLMEKYRK
jgi:hypothetical protein